VRSVEIVETTLVQTLEHPSLHRLPGQDASAGGPPDLAAIGAVMRRYGLTPAA
jgi:hypothetical protein